MNAISSRVIRIHLPNSRDPSSIPLKIQLFWLPLKKDQSEWQIDILRGVIVTQLTLEQCLSRRSECVAEFDILLLDNVAAACVHGMLTHNAQLL